tara:strand:- start:4851 stop:5831 length:981 start_codon:yes stop_codon:yes gene_type:complete
MNTPTAATATITFTGNATTNQIITITSTDGTELTYTAKTSGNSAARTFDGNNGAATCASTLKSAIEDSTASTGGHAGRITVSIDGAVLTLTQATKGAAGNIAITENVDNCTVSGFSGGTGVIGVGSNKGVVIAHAGNTTDFQSLGLGKVLGAGSEGGTKPVQTAAATATEGAPLSAKDGQPGVITAKGGGTFAFENQRGLIRRVTTSINNVADETLLSSGVGKGGRANSSIGGLEEFYPLPHYSYNEDGSLLAKINSPGGVDKDTGWDASSKFIDPAIAGGNTASTDSAANPTRAIPGELVYTATSKARSGALAVPKQDDYKEKTS